MSSEIPGKLTESKYSIDSELGQFDTISHKLINGKETLYDTGNAFFEPTTSRERFKSNHLKELMLKFATFASTRISTELINRVRHEEKGTIVTTYRNYVESEGIKIQKHIENKCDDVLQSNDFTENNGVYEPPLNLNLKNHNTFYSRLSNMHLYQPAYGITTPMNMNLTQSTCQLMISV